MEDMKMKNSLISELEDKLEEISSKEFGDLRVKTYVEFAEKYDINFVFDDIGINLEESDAESMEKVINYFIQSGCKSWNEFSLYLADEFIKDCKNNLLENKNS
jgi:hypothetical protein